MQQKNYASKWGGLYHHVDVNKWPDMKMTGPINKCVSLANACTAFLVTAWCDQIGFKF